jgi:hypothetical protein
LHASTENKSNANRLVVVLGVIPKEAEMRYYYQENGQIVEYACSPSFFMNENPSSGPQCLQALRTIEYKFPLVSFSSIDVTILKGKGTRWQKFLQLFR